MALFAIVPLLKVNIDGPRGGEWNSLLLEKMKREMFSSLVAPVIYYSLLLLSSVGMVCSKEPATILIFLTNAISMFSFLYRVAPNILAWGLIMRVVHTTASAAQSSGCMDQVMKNIETELKRQADAVVWSYKETPSSAVFEHSEWLARQLGFWKKARKSLSPD
jgi:hypothetical protein